MRNQTVTLLDVARAAGVSRTTASAALGGSGRISEGTRERVRSTAERLGYRGNAAARHLRQGRAGVLGLHLPFQVGMLEYYMRFVFGAAEGARRAGYALTILPAGHDAASALDGVDGVLIVDPLGDDPGLGEVLDGEKPCVASERIPGEGRAAEVVVEPDHRAAIEALFDHLLARGARRPAFIGAGTNSSWGLRSARAYERWCAQRGLAPILEQTSFTASAREVAQAAERMLDAELPPDAIVSAPDGTALGVLDAVHLHGLAVGEDVLVAGAVDSTPYRYVTPGVTALDHRPAELGELCAGLLIERIAAGGRAGGDDVVAPAHPLRLVERGSTGAPAA
jgi:DNA-binding LacI/PurR family transcriptional regulator